MAYSNLSCVGCKGSFGMDPNGYRAIVFDMKKPQNTPQSLINMLFNIQLGLPSDQTSLMCTMGRIPNCTAYTMYNQCTACVTGFYLSTSTKSCLAMPTFITYNCKTFALATNVLSCSECQTGYKINSGACTILDTYKQGCNQYSTTGANDCTSCEPQYYLATNTCTLRSKAILNCQQLSQTADECLACKEGFWYFSSVSIKTCLPVLQNCKMGFHSATNVGTTLQVISCTECMPNYLLSQDKLGCGAITTPIKNCDGYNKNNYCQTCTNGFLTSTQCNKQHSLIDQCGKYSQINQNSCV